ncbi:MAG: GxxExxY protein [Opitutales bacterium]|jgi:GxxExxY protein
MDAEDLCHRVIGAAIEVHRHLGPGLLESAYETCLAHEIRSQGLQVETQLALPVSFKGLKLDASYRLDLIVEHILIIEVKAVEELHPVHTAQVLTYLKLIQLSLGLIINFNVPVLKDGLKRVVCKHNSA